MKIVMNEAGAIVATHGDDFAVPEGAYEGYGPVLVGVIEDANVILDDRGDYQFVSNVKPLDVAKDLANQMVRDAADSLANEHMAKYPKAEIESWPTKLAEAQKIQAGDDGAATVLIKALSEASGQSASDIADAVIAKAAEFSAIAAQAEILRTTAEAKIKAAKSLTGVKNAVEAALA